MKKIMVDESHQLIQYIKNGNGYIACNCNKMLNFRNFPKFKNEVETRLAKRDLFVRLR